MSSPYVFAKHLPIFCRDTLTQDDESNAQLVAREDVTLQKDGCCLPNMGAKCSEPNMKFLFYTNVKVIS